MTNSERIKVARGIMEMAEVEAERKKESGEEIRKRHDWIDAAIVDDPDQKGSDKAIKDCRKWYSEIDGFEKDRSKQGHRVKNLRQAFEDCVMGEGQFDANQIDFSDIADNWIGNKDAATAEPKKIEHVWKQTNENVESMDKDGNKIETFKCINCKVTATMKVGGNEDIKRDEKYASSVFAFCGQEEKDMASGGKKPAQKKKTDPDPPKKR